MKNHIESHPLEISLSILPNIFLYISTYVYMAVLFTKGFYIIYAVCNYFFNVNTYGKHI